MKPEKDFRGVPVLADPVFCNLFEVRFKSELLRLSEAKMLTEQIKNICYTMPNELDSGFGIIMTGAKRVDMSFNLNIFDDKIQPLAILEKLQDKLPKIHEDQTDKKLDIKIVMHDKRGTVLRTITLCDCKIIQIDCCTIFDYENGDPQSLYLNLCYDNIKIKNG